MISVKLTCLCTKSVGMPMAMGVSDLLKRREKKLPFLLALEAVELLVESVLWLVDALAACGEGSMDLTLAMNSLASLQSVKERPTIQF